MSHHFEFRSGHTQEEGMYQRALHTEEIVNSKLSEGDTILMDLDETKSELTIKIKKGKKKPEIRTESATTEEKASES